MPELKPKEKDINVRFTDAYEVLRSFRKVKGKAEV